jgi:hypothetical protein
VLAKATKKIKLHPNEQILLDVIKPLLRATATQSSSAQALLKKMLVH